MCGDTSIGAPIQNVIARLKELESFNEETNETLYSKQFKVSLVMIYELWNFFPIQTLTSAVLHEKKFDYTMATAPNNVAKNRYSTNLARQ